MKAWFTFDMDWRAMAYLSHSLHSSSEYYLRSQKGVRSIVMSVSVCVFVCLSACT